MAGTKESKPKTSKAKSKAVETDEDEEMQPEEKKQNDVGKIILDYIDKGVEVSQKGFRTASKAISDFGDKSVLTLELTQLKKNQKKEFTALGMAVYEKLSASKSATVSSDDEGIGEVVKSIDKIAKDIKKHENALKGGKKSSSTKKTAADKKELSEPVAKTTRKTRTAKTASSEETKSKTTKASRSRSSSKKKENTEEDK
mgnify:CR=1 FL=1